MATTTLCLSNLSPDARLRCKDASARRTGSRRVRASRRAAEVFEPRPTVRTSFVVPEDQYILHTAQSQYITLPFACRHSCCTSCAIRIKSGQIRQLEALGISAELKE
ncbi:hypothetical protein LUZ63_013957 [Rhynchospora breviuscula]|uniref:2Fe-2S ferredoxin-type domain-containing protein n=1 Tax=Rhynchospora breviuscula TaxID=2022672 RepID=A0A9Q0HKP4_9POAL|nr:hypothetical protein LUZ63_013957 [Rhynchospora breviuscula]